VRSAMGPAHADGCCMICLHANTKRVMTSAWKPKQSFHMSAERVSAAWKRDGRLDCDYYERSKSFAVLSQASARTIAAALPPQAPECGESFDAMMADRHERLVLPGITHWQSPNFFAVLPFQ